MRILYNDILSSATLTSASENVNYPIENIIDDRLTRYYRSVDCSDQWIKFSYSAAVTANYIYLVNHNITTGATVKIEGNATDVWTSPTFSETITVTSDNYIYHLFASNQSFKYWRLTIDDDSNTDGYIKISKIFFSQYLDMPGMNIDQSIFKKSTGIYSKSSSGQIYGEKRIKLKTAKINFQDVEKTDLDLIADFYDEVDKVTPFILLIWEDDLTVEAPLYVNLTKDIEFARMPIVGSLLYQFTLEFEECF